MRFEKPQINLSQAAYDAAELSIDVGSNIFAARTKKGWTQVQLAKRLKTLQPSIARLENGNSLPSLDFLIRIAKALGTGLIAPTFESLVQLMPDSFSKNSVTANIKTSQKMTIKSPYQSLGEATNFSTSQESEVKTISGGTLINA